MKKSSNYIIEVKAQKNINAFKVGEIVVNKEFKILFYPKDRSLYNGKRCFLIGAKSLAKYIGEVNAKVTIEKAFDSGLDRFARKLRNHGEVVFYSNNK